ncbi:MAG: TIGR03936 family radical SAM-associated protein [Anaerolineales bacterium]
MGSTNDNQLTTMRIRVKFAKTEPMRFTSHLDLYRAWERLLRRADLSLVFSQGYNPRPKLQLAAPLALGITSQAEIIDFWLDNSGDDLKEITTKLLAAQPPGIEVKSIESIDPGAPALQKQVSAADYQVILLDPVQHLDQKIESLLSSEELIRQRRDKTYDLRPLILRLGFEQAESQFLQMSLSAREGSTGRPEEVLLALEIAPENTRIERTQIIFQK